MAAEVGLGLEVDVGSSLEVSRAKLGQRLFSLDGGWAAEAGGSGSRVPFPERMKLGRRQGSGSRWAELFGPLWRTDAVGNGGGR